MHHASNFCRNFWWTFMYIIRDVNLTVLHEGAMSRPYKGGRDNAIERFLSECFNDQCEKLKFNVWEWLH